MIATLRFSLPDEHEEFVHATKATDYYYALSEFAAELRKRDKYDAPPPESWADIRALFAEYIRDTES